MIVPILLRLLLAALLTLQATADHATVQHGGRVTIAMPVTSPNGAHIELIKDDAYIFVSGGIDHGVCGFSGCNSVPGTAVMTETIQIAEIAPLGPLTLTALASAADGSYVTATVQLEVVDAPLAFTARWQSPTVARLSWQQPADVRETCLVRNQTLITCWPNLPAGETVFRLGAQGPLDGNFRPAVSDVYTLAMDGRIEKAPLVGRVYLGVMWR